MCLGWHQLRTKLLVLFMGLLLLPAIGTGIYGALYLSQQLHEQALRIEQERLNGQAQTTQTLFEDTQQALHYIVATRVLQVLENSAPESDLYRSSQEVLQRDLSAYLATHPHYQRIAVYNAIAEPVAIVARVGEDVQRQTLTQADGFAPFVSQILSAPVETTHLTVDAVGQATTREVTIGFRSQQSVILITFWSEWLFQPASNALDSGTWSLQLPIQTVLHDTHPDKPNLLPALESNDVWLRQLSGNYRHDDATVFFTAVSVPTVQDSYTLRVFHTLPSTQLSVSLIDYYRNYSLVILGVLLCVLATVLFAVDRVIKPIEQLKEAMERFRTNQKSPPLPDDFPPDEVGELSLAFHTMASELAQKRQSERALVEKLINAQEDERKRVAYELHDGLIQQLVGARLQLSSINTDSEVYQHGVDALSTAIADGRRIMQGLHPSILDDLGIAEAVRELAHMTARRADWTLHLDLQPLANEPDKIISVTLYRIVQEALNNAYKHADATTLTIALWQDENYHLVIQDDGMGFDAQSPPQPHDGGWGLRTMSERVDLLYGKIEVESSPRGTTINIMLPNRTHQQEEGTLE